MRSRDADAEPLLVTQASASTEGDAPPSSTTASTAFRVALVNTLKSVVGTGLLAMPWAFVQLQSMPLAAVLCILIGAWNCYTMSLLHRCIVLAWPVTGGYGDLVTAALGPLGGWLCSVNLFVHQIACVAAYLVFIGDSVQSIVGGSTSAIILTAAPIVILLCWLRDVRALGPASAIGTAAMLLSLVLVLYEGCAAAGASAAAGGSAQSPAEATAVSVSTMDLLRRSAEPRVVGRSLAHQRRPRQQHRQLKDHHNAAATVAVGRLHASSSSTRSSHAAAWRNALGAFTGICMFTFSGHSEVVPIVSSLGASHPRDAPYGLVVLAMGAFAIPAVLGFSVSASMCFGADTRKNILLSLSSQTAAMLKALMALAVLFTCPLKMFPAFELSEAALGLRDRRGAVVAAAAAETRAAAEEPTAQAHTQTQLDTPHACSHLPAAPVKGSLQLSLQLLRNGQRAALVLLAVLLALACPDFEFLVALTGAFSNALIAFVLPPLMYCMLLLRKAPWEEARVGASLAAHALLLALGTVVLVGGTYAVVRDKLHHADHGVGVGNGDGVPSAA
jgi:amino acid permease